MFARVHGTFSNLLSQYKLNCMSYLWHVTVAWGKEVIIVSSVATGELVMLQWIAPNPFSHSSPG